MSVGDTVKVGFVSPTHGVAPDNVPVYELEKDAGGNPKYDINDCAFARPCGGVKGGMVGKIVGAPVKVLRGYVERNEGTKGFGGSDYVMLFPVYFDYYQKTAYVHQNHLQIVHGQLT